MQGQPRVHTLGSIETDSGAGMALEPGGGMWDCQQSRATDKGSGGLHGVCNVTAS